MSLATFSTLTTPDDRERRPALSLGQIARTLLLLLAGALALGLTTRNGEAALLTPAGPGGPSVTGDRRAIRSHNTPTAPALGVALPGDRVAGGGPLGASWPAVER